MKLSKMFEVKAMIFTGRRALCSRTRVRDPVFTLKLLYNLYLAVDKARIFSNYLY